MFWIGGRVILILMTKYSEWESAKVRVETDKCSKSLIWQWKSQCEHTYEVQYSGLVENKNTEIYAEFVMLLNPLS